mgnify:CR=1 FL=1
MDTSLNSRIISFSLLILVAVIMPRAHSENSCNDESISHSCVQVFVNNKNGQALADMVVYLEIKLVPTGEIVNVEIFSRNASASDAFVASAKTAALKVARFDRLSELDIGIFDANFRNITLKFKPEDLRL